MTLDELNALPAPACEAAFQTVCSAPRWAAAVTAARPYASVDALQDAAATALAPGDLDPAVAGHARIGDRSASGTSGREQAAVADAGADVHAALAEGNAAYEARFGHVYLVCASGRSAEDLLATLHARLTNDAPTERAVALSELAAINRIRIAGMVS
ncbi:MAG TPA: 2-oxo-4-hydroxy-4-carboxy-5-ureidoimidazoline decarboxylase [Pseudonocardia sp.]